MTSNIGSLVNKGVELALTYKPISTKDWYWEITANATYNSNEITELIGKEGYYVPTGGISTGIGNYAQAHAVGHPASSFYVYQQVYDEAGKPIEARLLTVMPTAASTRTISTSIKARWHHGQQV